MSTKIIIKSLVESLISWVVLALVLCLMMDVPFVQSLIAPQSIVIAVSAFVGSCIGFQRKEKKQNPMKA